MIINNIIIIVINSYSPLFMYLCQRLNPTTFAIFISFLLVFFYSTSSISSEMCMRIVTSFYLFQLDFGRLHFGAFYYVLNRTGLVMQLLIQYINITLFHILDHCLIFYYYIDNDYIYIS